MFQVNPEYIISDMSSLTNKAENLKSLLDDVDKRINSLTTQGWVSDSAKSYYNKINTYVTNAKQYLDKMSEYFSNVSSLAQKSIDNENIMFNSLN